VVHIDLPHHSATVCFDFVMGKSNKKIKNREESKTWLLSFLETRNGK